MTMLLSDEEMARLHGAPVAATFLSDEEMMKAHGGPMAQAPAAPRTAWHFAETPLEAALRAGKTMGFVLDHPAVSMREADEATLTQHFLTMTPEQQMEAGLRMPLSRQMEPPVGLQMGTTISNRILGTGFEVMHGAEDAVESIVYGVLHLTGQRGAAESWRMEFHRRKSERVAGIVDMPRLTEAAQQAGNLGFFILAGPAGIPLIGLSGFGRGYESAIEHGATPGVAWESGLLHAGVDVATLRLLRPLSVMTKSRIANILINTAGEGVQWGIAGAIMQGGDNMTAKALYEKDRSLFDKVLSGFAGGTVAGVIMGAIRAVFRMPSAGAMRMEIAEAGREKFLEEAARLMPGESPPAPPEALRVESVREARPGAPAPVEPAPAVGLITPKQETRLRAEYPDSVLILKTQSGYVGVGKDDAEVQKIAGHSPITEAELPEVQAGLVRNGRRLAMLEPIRPEGPKAEPPKPEPGPNPSVTSIKNAQVDAERAARGLPPAMQPAAKGFGTVWDEATKILDENPQAAAELVNKEPHPLTDTEDALLLHRQLELQNEYAKTADRVIASRESGDTGALREAKAKADQVSDELLRVYDFGKASGTESGRGLAARKMAAAEDFSLASMETQKRVAKGGDRLTEAERAEVATLQKEIAAKDKQIAELLAQKETAARETGMSKTMKELKTPAAPKGAYGARNRLVTPEGYAVALARLREKLGRVSMGLDPTVAVEVGKVGLYHFEAGLRNRAAWFKRMIDDGGEKVYPYLADAWKEAQQKFTEAEGKRIVGRMQNRVAGGGTLRQLGGQIHQLAKTLVEGGITEREPLIDAVHGVLREIDPNITRREVMDAISGYGQWRPLSKDEIDVQLRDLKGQMQQVAKLEDMAAGQAPVKTGFERRTPSDAEKKLIQLVNRAKVMGGYKVTDPETQLKSALQAFKTRTANRITDLEERLAAGDYSEVARRPLALDVEAQRLKIEKDRLVEKFRQGLAKHMLARRSIREKVLDTFVKWRRGFVLSSPVVFAKLTSAAVQRMVITPTEELVGAGYGKVFKRLAAKAPREGGINVSAEAQALTEGFTKGMHDAWQTAKTGKSDLDHLYGKRLGDALPPEAIDFLGHLHGMLKAPVKRTEFARSFAKRTQWSMDHGEDVTDPFIQTRNAVEAYKDGNRSIFLQDNAVTDAYKRLLSRFEQVDPATGHTTIFGKAAATTLRTLLPIVKVPTNIVAETFTNMFGTFTGAARLANAYAKGVEKVRPEQADLIMRELKKGTLGTAVLLLGYFAGDQIGGFYQPGEKRRPGDVPWGQIRLFGWDVPPYLLHNPLILCLQVGATVRRLVDSKVRRHDREAPGYLEASAKAMCGVIEEVPFVREAVQVQEILEKPGEAIPQEVAGIVVPQAAQFAAKQMDRDAQGRLVKRKAKGIVENIEAGVPALRQTLPKKPGQ